MIHQGLFSYFKAGRSDRQRRILDAGFIAAHRRAFSRSSNFLLRLFRKDIANFAAKFHYASRFSDLLARLLRKRFSTHYFTNSSISIRICVSVHQLIAFRTQLFDEICFKSKRFLSFVCPENNIDIKRGEALNLSKPQGVTMRFPSRKRSFCIPDTDIKDHSISRMGVNAPMFVFDSYRHLLSLDEIDRAADARELPEQGFLFGARGELEAETAEDYQGAGRYSVSAERRSRTRGALARSAGSPFVSSRSRKIKAALTRHAIPPRHECRGFSRVIQ